jgi:hypothetical protein
MVTILPAGSELRMICLGQVFGYGSGSKPERCGVALQLLEMIAEEQQHQAPVRTK